ncbi:MAG TPA: FkbM family methyltransferase [Myxococcota bacterium]|nr:FkbM family methyltransferase [Myxococcota bacterium]
MTRLRWWLGSLGRYPRFAWRLLTRPTRVRLHGVVLELGPDATPALRRALYSERYERGEARCVRLRVEPGDVVLEVGAGLGLLSTLCALRVGSENVTAYEANPALLPRIRATYAANGVAPRLVNAVLARKAGEAELYVEGEFASSSLLRRSDAATRVRVPQHVVGEVIARVNPTCLVIDIEGGEVELLPAIDLRGVRKLILELHPHRVGETRTAMLVTWLTAQGLREDRAISSTRKKYFARAV